MTLPLFCFRFRVSIITAAKVVVILSSFFFNITKNTDENEKNGQDQIHEAPGAILIRQHWIANPELVAFTLFRRV